MSDLAGDIIERYSALKERRAPFESLWAEVAKYVITRRVPGMGGTMQMPSAENDAALFDTTAAEANQTLANGQLAWMSPLETPWFAFEAEDKDAEMWLSEVTRITQKELANSNTYTALHEFYLDRSAFGTACLYVEAGKKGSLNVRHWPCGSYVIDEDSEGDVDTVIQEITYTTRQMVQIFGEKNVHPKVAEKYRSGPKGQLEKVKMIRAIYPRPDGERDKGRMDPMNMPIASVHVDVDNRHVCRNSGYNEIPFMVSRFLQWGTAMPGGYGWGPGIQALPDSKHLNALQKMLDALAEKAAFPPMLIPEALEGEIDANAHGANYFSAELASMLPRELQKPGDYTIGLERVKGRQEAINRAFHVDLFRMFAQIDKRMTATEVAERAGEKLIQFSPTFAKLTTELFNPFLERVFALLLEAGKFGTSNLIPKSLVELDDGQVTQVRTPGVIYSSRIALALRARPSIGYGRLIERLPLVAQFAPEALDIYNFEEAERTISLTDGLTAKFHRDKSEVDAIRAARAQAAQAAQQRADAALAADAAAKVGRVPPGSAVGKAIESQVTGEE